MKNLIDVALFHITERPLPEILHQSEVYCCNNVIITGAALRSRAALRSYRYTTASVVAARFALPATQLTLLMVQPIELHYPATAPNSKPV